MKTSAPRKPLKQRLLSLLVKVCFFLVFAVLGGLLAAYAIAVTESDAVAFGIIFGGMLMMLLSMGLQIILHEAGHMVCGLMTGYGFVSFNVFGYIWKKEADGKLRFGRMQIAGAGGQCLMDPPDYADGQFPFTLYNMGGVLMNLLVSAVCTVLAVVCFHLPALFLFFASMALIGVLFALINGLPVPVAAIQNDGRNQLCISRDQHARRAFWVQMRIAAELARGKRLGELPEAWYAPFPEETMSNPIVASVAVIGVSRHMDRLDFAAAEAEASRLLARREGIVDLHRMAMGCEGATCELILHRAATPMADSLATKENQQIMQAMKTNPSVLRTQYAIALLKDRDEAAAEKCLQAFEAAVPAYPNQQEIENERQLIRAIQQAAEEEKA